MRYFIQLSYDGTKYHGWQRQPNGVTVQEEMERALLLLLRERIQIVGAGRTDTGVHARTMVAHFDTEKSIDCQQAVYRLNRILPRDIAVSDIRPVADDMHARFSAVSRTYHYYIHTHKDPFLRQYSLELHYDLDFALMNQAAAMLLEQEDFGSFCKSNSDAKTTLCHVSEAEWVDDGNGSWHFTITANRFLRNMVRAIVGTLIDVGRHRLTLEDFHEIIAKGTRTAAGESMPGNALFLEKIAY